MLQSGGIGLKQTQLNNIIKIQMDDVIVFMIRIIIISLKINTILQFFYLEFNCVQYIITNHLAAHYIFIFDYFLDN